MTAALKRLGMRHALMTSIRCLEHSAECAWSRLVRKYGEKRECARPLSETVRHRLYLAYGTKREGN